MVAEEARSGKGKAEKEEEKGELVNVAPWPWEWPKPPVRNGESDRESGEERLGEEEEPPLNRCAPGGECEVGEWFWPVCD